VLMDIDCLDEWDRSHHRTAAHCRNQVVILSMYDDENSVVGAIRSGARAFVLKKASSTEMLDALRTVARGGSYLSSQVSTGCWRGFSAGSGHARPQPLESLSPANCSAAAGGRRQDQQGYRRAARPGLQTIRSYRKTMMKKLGVNNVRA